MIYFQGTDNKLWRANPDGSAGINLGDYQTKSTPIVFGDYVYFQGTDDKLWKINLDGSGGVNLGGYEISSTPFLTAGYVYFQGTDNKLWKVNLSGTDGVNLGGYQCKSTPFVSGQYVYFQGTDNKLWRIDSDGTGGINLGLYQTNATPFVTQRYVYFQGTDDKLWQIHLDGTGGVNLAGYKTSSSPFVTAQHVYFRGTDDKLWQINLDGSAGINLGRYQTKSSPTVDTSSNFVYFQGTDNALWRIDLDGSNGVHVGGFDTSSTPFVVQPSNQPQSGTAIARYMVLTVIYSPPGTNGGKSSSSVDYGNGSLTGSTTSISSSFKDGLDISASVGGGKSDGSASGSLDFGFSKTTTDSSSIDIKKSETFDISTSGPAADGINHDEDLIYLWLNPQLTVTIDPWNNLNWELGIQGPQMVIQYLHVGWLKNPSTMPAGLQQQLSAAGLTADDYAVILTADPFASGSGAIDPNRFVPTTFTFPYNPPLNSGDPVPLQKLALQNTLTYTTSHSVQTQFGVSLTGSVPVLGSVLKAVGQLQWTNTSSSGSTNQTTQTATVVVGGPAFGYSDGADVQVYWDTIYNSFMFAFLAVPPSLSGTFTDALGAPVPHQEVEVTAGPHVFHTITDAKGQYRFYGTPSGPGKVTAVASEMFPPKGIRGLLPGNITKLALK